MSNEDGTAYERELEWMDALEVVLRAMVARFGVAAPRPCLPYESAAHSVAEIAGGGTVAVPLFVAGGALGGQASVFAVSVRFTDGWREDGVELVNLRVGAIDPITLTWSTDRVEVFPLAEFAVARILAERRVAELRELVTARGLDAEALTWERYYTRASA